MNVASVRRRLLLSILLAVVVFGALLAYGDVRQMSSSLHDFRWELVPLLLLLSLGNYFLRFAKWHYYVREIGERDVTVRDNLLVFFSGLGMVITPGKVGEWVKSYFLKEMHGTPVTRSAPILLAERLTDALALLIIAAAGVVVLGPEFWPVAAVVVVGAGVGVAATRHRPTAQALLRALSRLPVLRRFTPQLNDFYESTFVVMRPSAVLSMTALSTLAWSCQVIAFYLTLVGLGVGGGGDTMLKAAFILPISTLVPALLLVPGGLGLADAGITSLCTRLLDMQRAPATLATLMIRLVTLWFAVLLGLAAFAVLTRRVGAREETPMDDAERQPLVARTGQTGI
ncbi:MAG TPA: lysylphosphatidylglycerol synthase transmembrane domain-containing protein [Dehalococcoidia bacterium]|nr:lysylphosphatidylglycerol synthase transmembrane domain-containing protein [Dehalococcoidia bacterium]